VLIDAETQGTDADHGEQPDRRMFFAKLALVFETLRISIQ
jgi:hypothetical protein